MHKVFFFLWANNLVAVLGQSAQPALPAPPGRCWHGLGRGGLPAQLKTASSRGKTARSPSQTLIHFVPLPFSFSPAASERATAAAGPAASREGVGTVEGPSPELACSFGQHAVPSSGSRRCPLQGGCARTQAPPRRRQRPSSGPARQCSSSTTGARRRTMTSRRSGHQGCVSAAPCSQASGGGHGDAARRRRAPQPQARCFGL